MSREILQRYLSDRGILSCNENAILPCLSDVGCTWADTIALIDSHALFYTKAFGRTIYLSPEVYYLLKACARQHPMPEDAAGLYEVLQAAPMQTSELKRMALLEMRRSGLTRRARSMPFWRKACPTSWWQSSFAGHRMA